MKTAQTNIFRSVFNVMCALLCALWLLTATAFAGGNDNWKPVSPEELAMKQPTIEKDADAEALLWDVYVTGEDAGSTYQTVLQHYLCIKIFSERGSEQFSKIDISSASYFRAKSRLLSPTDYKTDMESWLSNRLRAQN